MGCQKDDDGGGGGGMGTSPNPGGACVVFDSYDLKNSGSSYWYEGMVSNDGDVRAYNVCVYFSVYSVILGREITLYDNVGSVNAGASADFHTSWTSGPISWRDQWITWTE